MKYPRYYPLIPSGTECENLVPLFPSKNQLTVVSHHQFALEERKKNWFYLICGNITETTTVHCPLCGTAMTKILLYANTQVIYTCDNCN